MLYYAQSIPGIEALLRRELEQRIAGASYQGSRLIPDKNCLLLFRSSAAPARLLTLRSAEDVFAVAARGFQIAPDRGGLRQVYAAVRAARPQPVLAVFEQLYGALPRQPSFRVVARAVGVHQFLRRDLARAVSDAVLDSWVPGWQLRDEQADIELWVNLLGSELLLGLRLSTAAMRHRERAVSLPAALRPALAACIVLLAGAEPEQNFLDPIAGSGTILLERAAVGRYQALLGGDSDAQAVAALRQNLAGLPGDVRLQQWDARKLPLPAASIDALGANLPFGRQLATGVDLRQLYSAFLEEWRRVLRPGRRMALLGTDPPLGAVARAAGFQQLERYQVQILGYSATLLALRAAALA